MFAEVMAAVIALIYRVKVRPADTLFFFTTSSKYSVHRQDFSSVPRKEYSLSFMPTHLFHPPFPFSTTPINWFFHLMIYQTFTLTVQSVCHSLLYTSVSLKRALYLAFAVSSQQHTVYIVISMSVSFYIQSRYAFPDVLMYLSIMV